MSSTVGTCTQHLVGYPLHMSCSGHLTQYAIQYTGNGRVWDARDSRHVPFGVSVRATVAKQGHVSIPLQACTSTAPLEESIYATKHQQASDLPTFPRVVAHTEQLVRALQWPLLGSCFSLHFRG
jgi:hypothetical protein